MYANKYYYKTKKLTFKESLVQAYEQMGKNYIKQNSFFISSKGLSCLY